MLAPALPTRPRSGELAGARPGRPARWSERRRPFRTREPASDGKASDQSPLRPATVRWPVLLMFGPGDSIRRGLARAKRPLRNRGVGVFGQRPAPESGAILSGEPRAAGRPRTGGPLATPRRRAA